MKSTQLIASPPSRAFRAAVACVLMPAFIVGGGLGGCAGMSDDQKAGTGIGAGIGAVIGGVAGAAVSKKKNREGAVVAGALAGGAIGGLIGSEIGKRVGEKRKKYKDDNAFLQDQLASAKRDRLAAEREQAELSAQVKDLQQRHATASANQDVAAQGKVRAEATSLRTETQARAKEIDEQIAFNEESARQIRAAPTGTVPADRLAELDREIAELKEQKVALSQDYETLARL